MNLTSLITELSNPRAYPHKVDTVEIRQTHISVVCLIDEWAYKIRKAVKFPFLDFSSLQQRHDDCEREVELNRRLAPDVYLGIVPVVLRDGQIHVEGAGEVVEWAVKMRRLPDDATLEEQLERDEISPAMMGLLGRRLAAFHASAASDPHIAGFARFDAVSRNILDNLQIETELVSTLSDPMVFRSLVELTRQRLEMLREFVEWRADHGMARDTHGDLRLDHVYTFPDKDPPADLCIIDCIEFNNGFRYADPVSDIAFLVMDLKFHGRPDLARLLAEEYFHASADVNGRRLLPLYVSYRAAVRAKVETLELAEPEIAEADRQFAAECARAHWLLALSELQPPSSRACLVVVCGLPGTGKTTLARGVAEIAGFSVIRTDVVRKELAQIPELSSAGVTAHSGIYTEEWTERTYAECLRRAMELLQRGQRIIVDGTFSRERHRDQFLKAARRLAVPVLVLICQADLEVIRRRLADRTGDASDADWRTYQTIAEKWEPAGNQTSRVTRVIDTNQARVATTTAANIFRAEDLLDPLATEGTPL